MAEMPFIWPQKILQEGDKKIYSNFFRLVVVSTVLRGQFTSVSFRLRDGTVPTHKSQEPGIRFENCKLSTKKNGPKLDCKLSTKIIGLNWIVGFFIRKNC